MNRMWMNGAEQKSSDLEKILREQKDKRGVPTRDARLPPDPPSGSKDPRG